VRQISALHTLTGMTIANMIQRDPANHVNDVIMQIVYVFKPQMWRSKYKKVFFIIYVNIELLKIIIICNFDFYASLL
jgi:hypothetical protein